ncbi:uncharacterized protein BDZ83DRAFT_263505 [Colletotrichum acutatum]|uniref:Uncharacterized protein n=1 Tax=Glomerella acutata TaxID=27357 RepID=A0AAD8XFX9_GLOAC|nr:uncharacterized protein BDZ83DRAFT_263505 [Colletotrichum acutatum]KAK1726359.1 hypothetical protein BDZ83DRAFT_263505 [Colletotrichum acutatum]
MIRMPEPSFGALDSGVPLPQGPRRTDMQSRTQKNRSFAPPARIPIGSQRELQVLFRILCSSEDTHIDWNAGYAGLHERGPNGDKDEENRACCAAGASGNRISRGPPRGKKTNNATVRGYLPERNKVVTCQSSLVYPTFASLQLAERYRAPAAITVCRIEVHSIRARAKQGSNCMASVSPRGPLRRRLVRRHRCLPWRHPPVPDVWCLQAYLADHRMPFPGPLGILYPPCLRGKKIIKKKNELLLLTRGCVPV